jgi:hypothetical protein
MRKNLSLLKIRERPRPSQDQNASACQQRGDLMHKQDTSIVIKSVVSILVALAFSMGLSLLLSIGTAFRLPPAAFVERAGIDFGMQLESLAQPRIEQRGAKLPPLVYVDVDVAACQTFNGGNERACRTGNPVPPCLILSFVKAATDGGARLIVIDVDLEPYANKPLPTGCSSYGPTLGKALTALPEGPLIIAPVTARPDNASSGDYVSDDALNIIPGYYGGRLRLANFVGVPEPQVHDGLMRASPLASSIRSVSGRPPATIPSAAFFASLAADSAKLRVADCVFYAQHCETVDHASVHQFRASIESEHAGAERFLLAPIFYSLRSLAHSKATEDCGNKSWNIKRLDCLYSPSFIRTSASDLVNHGEIAPWKNYFAPYNSGEVKGIAFLGSSLPSALDVRATPIGAMAGTEVLINATRSMFDFDPAEFKAEESRSSAYRALELFVEKSWAAVKALPIFFLCWLFIHWIMRGSRSRPAIARFAARAACVAAFALTLSLVAWLELGSLLPDLLVSAISGLRIDLITPILALGLEGYAEGSAFLVHSIEPAVERSAKSAGQYLRQVLGKLKVFLASRGVPAAGDDNADH